MFITDQNGTQMWTKMLKENFNVTDSEKLNWVSKYASIHEIHESNLGVNGVTYNAASAAGYVPATPGGVSPIYSTPLNVTGMGNVAAPQNPNVSSTDPNAVGNLWNQTAGSGDVPVSTLPMALNVALLTIGLELVPVIPATGPWVMLSYMDFPYAGGKLGRVNETSLDGVGEGKENKPIYVKAAGLSLEAIEKLRNGIPETTAGAGDEVDPLAPGTQYTITGTGGTFTGNFIGFGRMDGAPLFTVTSCVKNSTPVSLREVFETATTIGDFANICVAGEMKADFVQTAVDFVDGFANFATGAKEAMTRAQNETGTGNAIGLRLFSKWVQVGSYEVTGSVTRQQLQDLPMYGVDAVGKVMEQMQNELTQHINARILERVFALGVTNHVQQAVYGGANLNLWMGKAADTDKKVSDLIGTGKFKDIYGIDHDDMLVKNAEALTSAENTSTRQRRIASRILAAANLIQTIGRRGRATWVVTNAQVASALQDVSGYVVAPMVNSLGQDGSQNLFMGGTLSGLRVYVDPYMSWDDCRVCVGRKGDGNSPGVVFLPYLLADTVQITAEGTMAPKMLVNSRFSVAEIGFYPETQYLTFVVGSEFGII